jgi:hypothetical protein
MNRFAGAGELRAGRSPVEQLGADRFFERRDAAADRCMIELESLGRGDELPAARHREENPDVVPIHAILLSRIGAGEPAINIVIHSSRRRRFPVLYLSVISRIGDMNENQLTIVRTYRGNQNEATRLFQSDAATLATEGYFPISQSWAEGSWGCGAFIVALLL